MSDSRNCPPENRTPNYRQCPKQKSSPDKSKSSGPLFQAQFELQQQVEDFERRFNQQISQFNPTPAKSVHTPQRPQSSTPRNRSATSPNGQFFNSTLSDGSYHTCSIYDTSGQSGGSQSGSALITNASPSPKRNGSKVEARTKTPKREFVDIPQYHAPKDATRTVSRKMKKQLKKGPIYQDESGHFQNCPKWMDPKKKKLVDMSKVKDTVKKIGSEIKSSIPDLRGRNEPGWSPQALSFNSFTYNPDQTTPSVLKCDLKGQSITFGSSYSYNPDQTTPSRFSGGPYTDPDIGYQTPVSFGSPPPQNLTYIQNQSPPTGLVNTSSTMGGSCVCPEPEPEQDFSCYCPPVPEESDFEECYCPPPDPPLPCGPPPPSPISCKCSTAAKSPRGASKPDDTDLPCGPATPEPEPIPPPCFCPPPEPEPLPPSTCYCNPPESEPPPPPCNCPPPEPEPPKKCNCLQPESEPPEPDPKSLPCGPPPQPDPESLPCGPPPEPDPRSLPCGPPPEPEPAAEPKACDCPPPEIKSCNCPPPRPCYCPPPEQMKSCECAQPPPKPCMCSQPPPPNPCNCPPPPDPCPPPPPPKSCSCPPPPDPKALPPPAKKPCCCPPPLDASAPPPEPKPCCCPPPPDPCEPPPPEPKPCSCSPPQEDPCPPSPEPKPCSCASPPEPSPPPPPKPCSCTPPPKPCSCSPPEPEPLPPCYCEPPEPEPCACPEPEPEPPEVDASECKCQPADGQTASFGGLTDTPQQVDLYSFRDSPQTVPRVAPTKFKSKGTSLPLRNSKSKAKASKSKGANPLAYQGTPFGGSNQPNQRLSFSTPQYYEGASEGINSSSRGCSCPDDSEEPPEEDPFACYCDTNQMPQSLSSGDCSCDSTKSLLQLDDSNENSSARSSKADIPLKSCLTEDKNKSTQAIAESVDNACSTDTCPALTVSFQDTQPKKKRKSKRNDKTISKMAQPKAGLFMGPSFSSPQILGGNLTGQTQSSGEPMSAYKPVKGKECQELARQALSRKEMTFTDTQFGPPFTSTPAERNKKKKTSTTKQTSGCSTDSCPNLEQTRLLEDDPCAAQEETQENGCSTEDDCPTKMVDSTKSNCGDVKCPFTSVDLQAVPQKECASVKSLLKDSVECSTSTCPVFKDADRISIETCTSMPSCPAREGTNKKSICFCEDGDIVSTTEAQPSSVHECQKSVCKANIKYIIFQ